MLHTVVRAQKVYGIGNGIVVGVNILWIVGVGRRGKKVCKNLATVKAFPSEHIIWQHVGIIPTDFACNKRFHAALFEYLRQCGAVSEHIRQPQHFAVYAKLPFHKSFAVQYLPYKAFAAYQVTVGFQPHCAFDVPTSFGNTLLYALVQFRSLLLDGLVQVALRRHKLVVGVSVHQRKHRCKTTLRLFTSLAHRPQPCYIDVRMPNAGNACISTFTIPTKVLVF